MNTVIPHVSTRRAFLAFLLFILAVLAAALPVVSARGQTSVYDGLPAGVADVGRAIETGDASKILAELPPSGTVVRTAHPGDGENVSIQAARTDIPPVVVSNPTQSDARGSGRYSVLAVWRPNVNPGLTLIVGSGIGPDGVRVSTAFGVEAVAGDWAITSYGRILNLDRTLQQWSGQGDLRVASSANSASAPPRTGNGLADRTGERHPWTWGAALAAAGVGLWAASRKSRFTARQ